MEVKIVIKNIIEFLGLLKVWSYFNKTPRVLFWHGVDYIKNHQVEAESISVSVFKDQIAFLNANYEIISINEYYNRYVNNRFTGKEIVLTFDDGYLNNLLIVAPYLYKQRIPFTVFISTEHITKSILYPTSVLRLILWGSGLKTLFVPSLDIFNMDISTTKKKLIAEKKISLYLKREKLHIVKQIIEELKENISSKSFNSLLAEFSSVRPMDWDNVRSLTKYGATIGSHCQNHLCCHINQLDAVLIDEITNSKKIIEKEIDLPCHFFAYPNGDFTSNTNQIVKRAGYKMGFSTDFNITYDKGSIYALPRLGVPFSLQSLKFILALYPKK